MGSLMSKMELDEYVIEQRILLNQIVWVKKIMYLNYAFTLCFILLLNLILIFNDVSRLL